MQAFSRYYFLKTRSRVFGELNASANGLDSETFVAGGFAIGANHEVTPKMALGALLGGEISNRYINNGSNFYPKIAFTSTIYF